MQGWFMSDSWVIREHVSFSSNSIVFSMKSHKIRSDAQVTHEWIMSNLQMGKIPK